MAAPVVLDAYPVVAFLTGEDAADEVAELLRRRARMSVVNAAEVVDVLVRVRRLDPEDVEAAVAGLLHDVVEPVAATRELALAAGRLRGAAYRRGQREVSLADCFAVVTAGPGGTIATADPALAVVAREAHVEVLPIPDSAGRRPRA